MFLKKKIGDLIRSYNSFDLHFGDAFHSPFHIFLNILILFQRKETISLRFASKRNEWVWLYWNINFRLVNYRHCLKSEPCTHYFIYSSSTIAVWYILIVNPRPMSKLIARTKKRKKKTRKNEIYWQFYNEVKKKKGTKLLRNIIGGKYITPLHLPFSFYFSPILFSLSSAIRIFKHVLFVLSSRVTYF